MQRRGKRLLRGCGRLAARWVPPWDHDCEGRASDQEVRCHQHMNIDKAVHDLDAGKEGTMASWLPPAMEKRRGGDKIASAAAPARETSHQVRLRYANTALPRCQHRPCRC